MALSSTVEFARKAEEYIRQDRSAELSQLLQTVESSGLLSEEFEHSHNDWQWPSVGNYLLHEACMLDSTRCIELLLQTDIPINAKDLTGWTVLHHAAWTNNEKAVVQLLKHKDTLDISTEKEGYTALHLASGKGHLPIVKYLVAAGADLLITSSEGYTAFHLAIDSGHLPIVEYLVGVGADPLIADDLGKNPLAIAVNQGHLPIVKYLVEAGAYRLFRGLRGIIPLHMAIGRGHLSIVKYLVEAGANPPFKTTSGKSALDWARECGDEDIVSFLSGLQTTGGEEADQSDSDETTGGVDVNVQAAQQVILQTVCNFNRLRLILLGEFGTGKTNFSLALVGGDFEPNRESSPSVTVSRTWLRGLLSDIQQLPRLPLFTALKENESLLATQTAHQLMQQEAPEEQAPHGDVPGSDTTDNSVSDFPPNPTTVPPHQSEIRYGKEQSSPKSLRVAPEPDGLSPDLLKQISQAMRASIGELANATHVEVWDCGGQMTMSAHQSVCMVPSQSLFAMVLNCNKNPHEHIDRDVYRYKGRALQSLPLFPKMSHLDYLRMWLSTLSLRQETTGSSEGSHQQPSTAVIICTHIDVVEDVQETKRVYNKIIKEIVDDCKRRSDEGLVIEGPFFVDNRSVDKSQCPDSEMMKVQACLAEFITKLQKENVPLLQLKLEYVLRSPHTSSGVMASQEDDIPPHITFEKFSEFADSVSNSTMSEEDVRGALSYFHQHSVVICRDHSDPKPDSIIFVSVEWLLLQFMELLSCPLVNSAEPSMYTASTKSDIEHLQITGFAKPTLLQKLWPSHSKELRDALAEAMCMLHLACWRYQPSEESSSSSASNGCRMLYVPFAIGKEPRSLPSCLASKSPLPPLMYVFKKCPLFPPPLFSRFAMLMVKRVCSRSEQGDVDVHFATLQYPNKQGAYVRVTWSPSGLVAELFPRKDEKTRHSAAVLCEDIDDCLAELRKEGYVGLKGERRFLCPSCHPEAPSAVQSGQWWSEQDLQWLPLSKEAIDGDQFCSKCREFCSTIPQKLHLWLNDHAKPSLDDSQQQLELQQLPSACATAPSLQYSQPGAQVVQQPQFQFLPDQHQHYQQQQAQLIPPCLPHYEQQQQQQQQQQSPLDQVETQRRQPYPSQQELPHHSSHTLPQYKMQQPTLSALQSTEQRSVPRHADHFSEASAQWSTAATDNTCISPDSQMSSSSTIGGVSRSMSLSNLMDTYDFGEGMRQFLDTAQRRKLARAFVKANKENVNNFERIVFDYIDEHSTVKGDFANVAGMIFYFQSKSGKTLGELFDIVFKVAPGCKKAFENLVRETEWDDD